MKSHAPAESFRTVLTAAIEGIFNGYDTNLCQVLGANNYVREFRTLHLNMGRRIGKTAYIAKHHRAFDLIVVHCEHTKQDLLRTYNIRCEVKTVYELQRDLRKYHWIWVDEPRLCSRSLTGMDWYYHASFSSDSLVIMLGE